MKSIIKKILASTLVVAVLALGLSALTPLATTAFAVEGDIQDGINAAQPDNTPTDLFEPGGVFNNIINTLLFVIGAIAVVMLIVGGIRYTISAGDAAAVTGAKNTILYAIIGIVIAFLAYAIVNWVLTQISG